MNDKNTMDEVTGEQIKAIFTISSLIDYERLVEVKKEFKNEISQYEAIGIVDGHDYFVKLDDMKGRYARLEALMNLIDVLHETQKVIKNTEE